MSHDSMKKQHHIKSLTLDISVSCIYILFSLLEEVLDGKHSSRLIRLKKKPSAKYH